MDNEYFIKNKIPYFANDNISQYLSEKDLEEMEIKAAQKLKELFEVLHLDIENDHNMQSTHLRVAKMYVRELMHGRYQPMPKVTDFPNIKNLDELYTVGPIKVRSMCSHHLAPVIGECHIGVLPSDRVIGLSKFNRIVDWVMSRPQIQEEATIQIADTIEEAIKPRGLAVVVSATHGCLSMRGVKDHDTKMTTSVMRGVLHSNQNTRNEFLSFLRNGK